MKLRILIEGPKVHDVGYRYFLMALARRARIRYFDADNIEGAVEVLVEGDEDKLIAFKKLVETSRPNLAEVSKISYEDYNGEIWPISEYSQFCTNIQMNKAIPILLDMLDKQGETIEAVRDLKRNEERFIRIEKDIKTIKSKIGVR